MFARARLGLRSSSSSPRLPWVVVLALASAPALADDGTIQGGVVEQQCTILVMDLDGAALSEADREISGVLTDALVGEVSAVSGCEVVSEAEIASMMKFEAAKASCAGELDSCLAEVGAAFGAERVVSGRVGRVGEDFLLSARLVDVRRGTVYARAEETVHGGAEGLPIGAKNLGRRLFDKAPLAADAPATADAATTEDAAGGGVSLSFVGGATLAGVAALLVGGGAVATGVSEMLLADPAAHDKDTTRMLGLVGLGGAGLGALVGLGGGALLAFSLVE